MRISDGSSDVCSSDLTERRAAEGGPIGAIVGRHIAFPLFAAAASTTESTPCDAVPNGSHRAQTAPPLRARGAALCERYAADRGAAHPRRAGHGAVEIGRASCRERVCQYV